MDFINLWDVKPNKISHLMSYIVCPTAQVAFCRCGFPSACALTLCVCWLMFTCFTLAVSCPDQSTFRPHQSFSTISFHTLFSENIR